MKEIGVVREHQCHYYHLQVNLSAGTSPSFASIVPLHACMHACMRVFIIIQLYKIVQI